MLCDMGSDVEGLDVRANYKGSVQHVHEGIHMCKAARGLPGKPGAVDFLA